MSLFSASNNTIGGAQLLGAGNVIGGNGLDGLVVDQANSNLIQGNKVGTDSSGTMALGNGTGVLIGFSNSAREHTRGNCNRGRQPDLGQLR